MNMCERWVGGCACGLGFGREGVGLGRPASWTAGRSVCCAHAWVHIDQMTGTVRPSWSYPRDDGGHAVPVPEEHGLDGRVRKLRQVLLCHHPAALQVVWVDGGVVGRVGRSRGRGSVDMHYEAETGYRGRRSGICQASTGHTQIHTQRDAAKRQGARPDTHTDTHTWGQQGQRTASRRRGAGSAWP